MFLTSLVVGITMVMGVNAVNSAPSFMLDYYKYIGDGENATPKNPTFWTNILTFYTITTLVAQTIHEPTNLTTFMCRFSLLFRLEMSILLMIVELLVIVIMPHTGSSEYGAMAALIIVAYIGGVGRAFFENTGYAMFGPCPSKMLSGMLVGSAVSGALVSVIQIVLKASMEDTYSSILMQSVLYFSLSLGIIFISAVLLVGLLFNPFAKQYIAEFRSRRGPIANIYRPAKLTSVEASNGRLHGEDGGEDGHVHSPSSPQEAHLGLGKPSRGATATLELSYVGDDDVLFDDRVALPREETEARRQNRGGAPSVEPTASRQPQVGTSSLPEDLDGLDGTGHDPKQIYSSDDEDGAEDVKEPPTTAELLQGVRLWPVIKSISPMMLSCLLTFGITYLMYPGVLLAVSADGWYQTIVMAVYNFGDLFGRVLSMWKRIWPSRKVVLIGSIARLLFVPLLFLNALGKIPGTAAAYVFTALLALSNGFFGTLSMVYAPETSTLHTEGERALAGQATGVCLLLGCSVGSLVQLALVLPLNS